MSSCGIQRLVALVTTDVSEIRITIIIVMERIGELGATLALLDTNFVPSSLIPSTLVKNAIRSYEPSTLTRATRRNIPEDGILHSHRRETSNLTYH
jgi:hypothetical protein